MTKKLYHQFVCSSLMLPEHRHRLAEHREKGARDLRLEETAPDEQQLEQFQRLVKQSMPARLPLRVTFIDNRDRRTFTGVIQVRQPEPDRLRFQSRDRVCSIPIASIVHLEPAPAQSTPDHGPPGRGLHPRKS